MSSAILRSYQVFGADDQVLAAAVEAVKKAVKDAKSKGSVQKVTLSRKGHRHDIEVGDIYVVPTSVCDDPADFPTILLNVNLRQHATGEGMVEFQMGALADPKELTRESLQAFKKVCFKNTNGDFAPLIVFAAAWAHPSAYQSFAYNEDTLLPNLRETAYASPFNPSLSSAFDQLRAVDPDAAPYARVLPVTQHIFSMPKSDEPVYPTFAKGLEVANADGGKKASLDRRPCIRLRMAADMEEMSGEDLTGDEINLFQDLGAEMGTLVKTTDPKQAAAYVDPMPMQGDKGLRAQPDYGAPDSKEQIHPAMVDGPNAMTASKQAMDLTDPDSAVAQATVDAIKGEDKPEEPIQVTGLVPDTPGEVENKAPVTPGTDESKVAAVPQDTVQAVNRFVEHWSGRLIHGTQLKAELLKLTDKLKPAVLFMKDMGYLVPEGEDLYKVRNQDLITDAQAPAKRAYVLRHADNRVWAAQSVDGLILGGEWTPDRTAAFRFASLQDVQEEVRRHGIAHEAKIAVKQCKCEGDCSCAEAKTAGSWWNPGSVIENFYPELQRQQVDSPFLSQSESPDLVNPFGAPGKETSQDPAGMGLNQGLDSNAGGVPLRQEMNIYGPEYARQFYAPKDNMSPSALKLKKHPLAASTGKQALAPLALAAPAIAEAALPAAAAAAPAAAGAAAGTGAAAGAGAATAAPAAAPAAEFGVMDALSTIPPPPQDNSVQASLKTKKAEGALALFQGLEVASPEEHPQAHFDETAPDGEPGAYVEPVKEDSVPQDDAFISMDAFLKGLVAAYAAQLIGAYKATGKPLTLATPYTDSLDLTAALEFAGAGSTPEALNSAKAQFSQALGNLNDDQRKMLLDNAVAQAAVWCPNTQGSGGFNYEVFVRAEKLDGTSLTVKVVTGAKGGK